jgi:hypothetical protein
MLRFISSVRCAPPVLALATSLAGTTSATAQSAAAILRASAFTQVVIDEGVVTQPSSPLFPAYRALTNPTVSQAEPATFETLCREHRWLAIVGSGVVAGGVTYLIATSSFLGESESEGVWKTTAVMAGFGAGLAALLCAV